MESMNKIHEQIKTICGYNTAMFAHQILQTETAGTYWSNTRIENYKHIIKEYHACENDEWNRRGFPEWSIYG